MPASVARRDRCVRVATRPGDQVILNDPFAGGTHLNDVTLVAPAFRVDGTLARLGRQPRAPRRSSAAWRPDRCPPRPRRSTKRGCGSRPSCARPMWRRSSWPRRARPRSGGATSTRNSAPTGSVSPGSERSARERARRSRRRTGSGGSAPRCRVARRTLRVRGRPRLDGWSAVGAQMAGPARIQVAVTVDGDDDHVRLRGYGRATRGHRRTRSQP